MAPCLGTRGVAISSLPGRSLRLWRAAANGHPV